MICLPVSLDEKECEKICQIVKPGGMTEEMRDSMPDRILEVMIYWKKCQNICQIECCKICPIECQKEISIDMLDTVPKRTL